MPEVLSVQQNQPPTVASEEAMSPGEAIAHALKSLTARLMGGASASGFTGAESAMASVPELLKLAELAEACTVNAERSEKPATSRGELAGVLAVDAARLNAGLGEAEVAAVRQAELEASVERTEALRMRVEVDEMSSWTSLTRHSAASASGGTLGVLAQMQPSAAGHTEEQEKLVAERIKAEHTEMQAKLEAERVQAKLTEMRVRADVEAKAGHDELAAMRAELAEARVMKAEFVEQREAMHASEQAAAPAAAAMRAQADEQLQAELAEARVMKVQLDEAASMRVEAAEQLQAELAEARRINVEMTELGEARAMRAELAEAQAALAQAQAEAAAAKDVQRDLEEATSAEAAKRSEAEAAAVEEAKQAKLQVTELQAEIAAAQAGQHSDSKAAGKKKGPNNLRCSFELVVRKARGIRSL